MLNNRETEILEELIKNGKIHENDILEKNKISKRAFLYNLRNINTFLQNMKLKELKKEGKIIYFDNRQNFEEMYSVIRSIRKFDRKERIEILEFILFFEKNLNLKKLSQELSVSKTTLKKDFEILKNILNKKKLKVFYRNNFGYYLEYDNQENTEWIKLKKISEFLSQHRKKGAYSEFIKKMSIFNPEKTEKKKISDFLHDINEKLKLNIGDETYKTLYSYLLVIKNEKIEKEKESLLFIEKTEEFKIIEKSLKKNGISDLNRNSVIKFTDFLMGVTISSLNLENWLNEEILIRKIMREFFKYADLTVNEDEILYECLLYHLKPTIYRIKKGIHLSNSVFRELIENKDP
ncbi:MAG: PRD domain-containing protein, partial [Leptotrichiaceae bacterium]|nr:PRD domain-containing protein [Leptotrichiaceae bacterium]